MTASAIFCLTSLFTSCSKQPAEPNSLRVLMDQVPATLNPRGTLDAAGQRINALLFRGLTRIDENLEPQPDLAEKWEVSDSGKLWKFTLRAGQVDHAGQPIDAARMVACLENYRDGKPISLLRSSFPKWLSTEARDNQVVFKLEAPDPYLSRNVTMLRYFTTGPDRPPCLEPRPEDTVIGSGLYRPRKWELTPPNPFVLLPSALASGRKALELVFVQDDNAKAVKLIRGDVDLVQNGISLTKTRWIQKEYADRFKVLERDGVSVAYLGFNLRDPMLARKEIRRALALGINREEIIRTKHQGFTTIAGSLLSPLLPESHAVEFRYDPQAAEALLDQAGFPRNARGVRLQLHYKTTPVREGIETALIFQEMLRRIGVELVVDVVEPAVFLASLRKGNFQLYSSRWLGVADGSILYNTLRTGHNLNRVGYHSEVMDRLLEQAIAEPDLARRRPLLAKVQEQMAEDLPYFPLWYWRTALIAKKELTGLEAHELSISGALEPLTRLR